MRMPYKKIPKRLVIEIVKLAAKLKSSLVNPSNNIHPIMSPRQLVTGIPLRLAETEIGQFVQAHTGGTSSTEKDKERTSDAIYIGRTDNGNGHEVLKMSTGQVVTVNKVTVIPVNNDHIARVNQMGALDGQCDGIVISNFYGDVTINDLDAEAGDDDSNASDDDFKFNKANQRELDDNEKTEDAFLSSLDSIEDEEVIGEEVEFQNDHFNRNRWIDMNADDGDDEDDNSVDEEDVNYALDEPYPNINEDGDNNSDEDPIHEVSALLTASTENKKKKKKETNEIDEVDDDTNEDDIGSIENDDAGDDASNDDGGDDAAESNEEPEQQNGTNQLEEDDEVDRANIPKELLSELGDYWDTMSEQRVASVYWIANLDDFVWNDRNDASSNVDRFVLSAMQSYYNSEPTPDVANIEGSHASKATPQFGFRKGMKLFGIEGWEATKKEINENLLGMDAVKMILYKDLDRKLQKEALSYLMFLKRKRTGVVKSRGVADGRPGRAIYEKGESSSPTVSTYALMCSCAIDAIENRKVITLDIPAAFLQTLWPKEKYPTYIRFDGEMVDMICEIDKKYEQYKCPTKSGRGLMYGEMNRAVYGHMLSSILWYQKLKGHLEEWGFEMNPYDECVFNKMVDGAQCTILYHVDDLKVSHRDQSVIDDMASTINETFKTKTQSLSVTRGNTHDYLGIGIDYSRKDCVTFTMYDYLEDILKEADERGDMNGTAVTPASDDLFTVDESSPKLNDEMSDYFHRVTARFLFAAKRARPDIQVAVAYLCTRVKCPTESDYHKLRRLVKYIRMSIHLPLIIGWDQSGELVWSVDASFAVHKDFRSHTGGCLSLGTGSLMSMSMKQKINTKSSTESELVGCDDCMNFMVWVKLFFEWQMKDHHNDDKSKLIGKRTVLLQDNTSAIQLERFGKRSSTKRTRHLSIKYHYVTSKLEDKTITAVTYHPTKELVADFLTKPLQGSLFRRHRNAIMGITEKDEAEAFENYKKRSHQ